MIVIKCDKCKKEFEVMMGRCESARACLGGMGFEQNITIIMSIEVMHSLKRKGSGEVLCRECWD